MKTAILTLALVLLGGPCRAAATRSTNVDLAWSLLKEDQLERAIPPLEAEARNNPRNPLVHYALGVCLAHTGDRARAVESLRRATEADPGLPHPWHYLRSLTENGGPQDLEYFKKAAKRHKKRHPHIHLNYGLMLLHQGREAEGLQSLRRAVELNGRYAEAHFQLGAAHFDGGRWGDATAGLRRAIAADPDYPEAKRLLSAAMRKAGQPADAEVFQREAVVLKPELEEADDMIDAMSDPERKKTWANRVDRAGRLPLTPLRSVGVLLSPLMSLLEFEPVGRAMSVTLSSAPGVAVSTPTARAPRSRVAVRWTSIRDLEPLPIEPLGSPDNITVKVRLGGRRLLWAYFTTPNYRFIAQGAPGDAVRLEIRRIPPAETRFDPIGSLLRAGELRPDEEWRLDDEWTVSLQGVGGGVASLRLRRKG